VLVAIVAYAHRAGAFVIAEGIESPEMLDFVRHASDLDVMRNLAIEGGQGFLLGRPTKDLEHAGELPAALEGVSPVGRLGIEPRPTD
jgi:EAL domain-containing protein (putative c-di-GMP-specific phosphodiesterase class I)